MNIKFIQIAENIRIFIPKLLKLTGKSLGKVEREIDFIDSYVRKGRDLTQLKQRLDERN